MTTRAAVAAVLCIAWSAWAAAQSGAFTARLSTTPIDQSLRATVTGQGAVSAVLDGQMLTVDGTFSGLAGPATAAHLHVGAVTGVRGPAVAELEVDAAASGAVHGTVQLSRAERAALGERRMYVQIASEAAPDGNLWGWLLPQE